MIRQTILSIAFAIGILYSVYEVISEYKTNKRKTTKKIVTYKMRYYSLWIIIFAYLVYSQWTM